MSTRDPRVDAYIANAPEFARPILSHIRNVIHKACPDVTETMKWSSPFFMRKAILCNMGAFKAHCSLNFWKGSLVVGENAETEGMGQFGKITSIKDLPSEKKLIGYVREAARLDEAGVKPVNKYPSKPKAPLKTPPDLAAGLKKNKLAGATFEKFPPSHRREYIEWVTEARRPETRGKRLATTLEWLAKGKTRHWRYEKC
jgi:uncharacterized protein YdeI (YjbR/CyaY-like superfamily)